MPLVRISLLRGKSEQHKRAVADQVYEAMREAFQVPENDRFIILTEHDAGGLDYDRSYLGIERSDDFVIVQITASNTRTVETKKAFYRTLAARLEAHPGIRPEDVFINIVETGKENWSFGRGQAQYV